MPAPRPRQAGPGTCRTPDDPLALIVFRIIWTCHRAVLAANALVVEMPDNSRSRVFLISVDRTDIRARRVEAMMARGCHMLKNGKLRRAAKHEVHVARRLAFVQAVQVVAGRDACLASGTTVEVDLKRKLLTRTWRHPARARNNTDLATARQNPRGTRESFDRADRLVLPGNYGPNRHPAGTTRTPFRAPVQSFNQPIHQAAMMPIIQFTSAPDERVSVAWLTSKYAREIAPDRWQATPRRD